MTGLDPPGLVTQKTPQTGGAQVDDDDDDVNNDYCLFRACRQLGTYMHHLISSSQVSTWHLVGHHRGTKWGDKHGPQVNLVRKPKCPLGRTWKDWSSRGLEQSVLLDGLRHSSGRGRVASCGRDTPSVEVWRTSGCGIQY